MEPGPSPRGGGPGSGREKMYELAALIKARIKADLSQADIAKLAEVTEKTIVNFENGNKARSAWGHRVILAYEKIYDGTGLKAANGPKTKYGRMHEISKTELARLDPETRALVEARHKAGFSQAEIAKRAGVSVGPIHRFELGLPIWPRVKTALKAAYGSMDKLAIEHKSFEHKAGDGLNAAWLERQVETFLHGNSFGVVERDKRAQYVISYSKIYELARIVLLAAGKDIEIT
jgi:DNA-binding XRE family transcriptional regulator